MATERIAQCIGARQLVDSNVLLTFLNPDGTQEEIKIDYRSWLLILAQSTREDRRRAGCIG